MSSDIGKIDKNSFLSCYISICYVINNLCFYDLILVFCLSCLSCLSFFSTITIYVFLYPFYLFKKIMIDMIDMVDKYYIYNKDGQSIMIDTMIDMIDKTPLTLEFSNNEGGNMIANDRHDRQK